MNIDRNKFLIAMARNKSSVNGLAASSGVSRVTLSALKSGKLSKVQPDTLGKIAGALKCDVTELIEG